MKRFMIIAGEASGDLYGAMLVNSLKDKRHEISFMGIGGPKMKDAGVALFERAENLSVVGIVEVLSRLKVIFSALSRAKKILRTEKIDGLILIDFPDFNFLLGRYAKKLGIRIFYFVVPQVWAWRRNRIKVLKNFVYKCVPVLPLEKKILCDAGINAEYAGHPLIDLSKPDSDSQRIKERLNIPEGFKVIALFPGSREREVKVHLPAMLNACRRFASTKKNYFFVLSMAPTISRDILEEEIQKVNLPVTISAESAANILSISDAGIAVSGTVTLEGALARKPLIVIYRLSWLTYIIAKPFVKVKFISLPNLILDKMIYPELVQEGITPESLSSELVEILKNDRYNSIVKDLDTVAQRLGDTGVVNRISEIFINSMVTE